MTKIYALLFSVLLFAGPLHAAPTGVYSYSADVPLDEAYVSLHAALEENHFWVVFEADLGARMASMKENFGDNYNRQGLSGIKAMVFCNIGWANRLASADPDLLSLCPLHMTLFEQAGRTTVVLSKPTVIAAGSPAADVAAELETTLTELVRKALSGE